MRERLFKNEAEFTKWLTEQAHKEEWMVARFHRLPTPGPGGQWRTPVGADGKGWPDLILVRERVIAAELKIAPNKPDVNQLRWIEALREAGLETYVWTDRMCDEIVRTLTVQLDPQRMARLLLAADGDIDHSVSVAKLLATKEGGRSHEGATGLR